MKKDKLNKYRKLLLEEKDTLEKFLDSRSAKDQEGIDHYPENELSTVDNHPADIGTEVFMREQDEGFKVSHKETLNKIEDSLENIHKGSYGKCSSCDKEIEEERLELIPYTTLCASCMKDEEYEKDKFESLDEEYITKNSKRRSNVHFDREDSYQEVAEFENIPKDPSDSTGDYTGVVRDEDEEDTEDIDNVSQEYYDETQE